MKLIFVLLLATVSIANAQSHWTLEWSTGSAKSFDRTLTIKQANQPDLKFSASYDTRGFHTPLYYEWRVGRWSHDSAWEVEWVHHKIFLTNGPSDIQSFSISHGYNLVMVDHAWEHSLIFRIGAGVVIAHPEATIRHLSSEPGYNLTGPVAQFSVSKRFYFTRNFFGQVEGKFTIARAHAPVADGTAIAPNIALHGLFGAGYQF